MNSIDVGNYFVTILSLVFLRMISFAVNSRKTFWKERAVVIWSSLLWFTYFHDSGNKMMKNKRNMAAETVAVLFIVSISDMSQPRRCTSDSNDRVYGMWIKILS